VTVRATASGPRPNVSSTWIEEGGVDPLGAVTSTTEIFVDGAWTTASVYDRQKLKAGNVIPGPAIIAEMDSTTLVLPDHAATVHSSGSLLIRPTSTN
jgi:N-methylhydantoinase A